MCEAMYGLLDRTEAAERLERWSREAAERGELRRAREHRQLWEGVMDLLDQLVELVGEEPLSRELFAGMLEAGLSGLKLSAVPPSLDQVLVVASASVISSARSTACCRCVSRRTAS
jgi:ATP-dependent helicase/nuclease subunit B